jgi:signal transduction histidine kinase
MLAIVPMARRPVVVIWLATALAAVVALLVIGVPPLTLQMLVSAAVLAALLGLGDRAAVVLEDGSALSPAPALLLAGLTVARWPPLLLAALVGTLASALSRRTSPGQALQIAGARCLIGAISAPIYHLLEPPSGVPYSTPLGLLGLLVMGAIAYAVEWLFGAGGWGHGSLLAHWRAQPGALRWYVLAMIPLGGLLGALWSVSPWTFLLGLAPLVVAQHSFRVQVALRQADADQARLLEQSTSLAARIERLQALATMMIGTLDVQAMLELLCERLAALLDAPYGWVVLRDAGGKPRLMACHNLTLADADRQAFGDPQSYAALFERGRVVLITDERRHALAPAAALGDSVLWSEVLGIPLVGEKQVLGAICLAFDHLRGLDSDEQRVLTSFARQAAMALENARLFDELHRKQAELIQSSKLAAVGTFAAGIAHEFNNLLGGMLGYAELGYRADDIEEKNRALDVVRQACRRGRSITQGLLTFARRQSNQRALADITDAIEEMLTLVELDLRKSKVEVVRQIEPVPLTVCDLGQIAQVVLNLITNARDAMRPNGGTLTIGLREQDGVIELSVADTGSGIPEELRDKIFEPFVTTKDASGGSPTPGTGLGLSVSYGIVKEHGGTIEVASEVGRGTTMTVRLPVTTEVLEPEAMVERVKG